MVYTFEQKYPYRKIRVWLGELPQINYGNSEVIETVKEASTNYPYQEQQIGVEFLRHQHSSFYGLLSVEFIPHTTHTLVTQINITNNAGEEIEWALAGSLDTVRSGFPLEYSKGIVETISNTNDFPYSGSLKFSRAAHGEMGSSIVIFQWLTNTIIEILRQGSQNITEEKLKMVVFGPPQY